MGLSIRALGAIATALGIAIGIAIGLSTFYRELEPITIVRPGVDLVYLYLRIDKVSPEVAGEDLYAVSYIAIVKVSNNYSYTLIPFRIDFTILGGEPRARVKIVATNGSGGVGVGEAWVTKFGVDTFWIPRHYVQCWIFPSTERYYILRNVKIVPYDTVKWLVEEASKGLEIGIRFDASLEGKKGGGENSIRKTIEVARISENEYLYGAIPEGVWIFEMELCGSIAHG